MKPLLIGQAPGPDRATGSPFAGSSGRRLAQYAHLSHALILSVFERVNLLDEWPGSTGQGDKFPLAAARLAARRVHIYGRVVVLAGRGVAMAFDLVRTTPWFRWRRWHGADVVVIPHPSGCNRILNTASAQRRTGAVIREAIRRAGDQP